MVENGVESHFAASLQPPVLAINRNGTSPFILLCDHASNRIPDPYGTLGLGANERLMHIAWDPGALAVSRALSDLLDAPLIHSTVSRLVIDCNRAHDAPDLIPSLSERTRVPGNDGIDDAEHRRRIAAFHTPYHQAIAALIDERLARSGASVIVAIHSFTPVYKDVPRPWPAGLIHGRDERFTRALFDALKADVLDMNLGWNEPYSAKQGVYHTVEIHADARDLHGTMIEIRNDEILEPPGVTLWARRLARCLEHALVALGPAPSVKAKQRKESELRRN